MHRGTILIVEDEALAALLLNETIKGMDFEVLGPVTSGEEALPLLEKAESVDLVLMDIELAGAMNGIDTALKIRESTDTPVIFLTSHDQGKIVEKAKQVDPYGYLIKPLDQRELRATVEMAMHRAALDRKLKDSQQALRESEERYRRLFEQAPVGIYRSSLEGRILMANDTLVRMFGCKTLAEFKSNYRELGAQLYVDDGSWEQFGKSLQVKKQITGFEFRAKKVDGDIIWLSQAATLVEGEQGESTIIEGFMVEITERKMVEDLQGFLAQTSASLKSESFFHALVRYLGETLNMEFAAISRLNDNEHAETLAVWLEGNFLENRIYPLEDTPGREVIGANVCSYASGVRNIFPKDSILQQVQAESYIGCTLWDHRGEPIGLINLMGRKRMQQASSALTLLGLTGPRAAGEVERLNAEQALQKSEERFYLAMQAAQHGLFEWMTATDEVYFSPAWKEMLGYRDNELDNTLGTIERLIAEDQAPQYLQALQEFRTGQRQQLDMNLRMQHRDGHWVDMRVKARLFSDGSGKLKRVIGTHVDISAKLAAERNYQRLFEQMLNGFALHEIIVDENNTPIDYRFLSVNPAFERMIGMRKEECVGKTLLEILPGSEKYWINIYGDVALTGKPAFFENYAKELDKFFEVTAFSPAPMQFACIFSDVTARRRAESEKQRLEVQLIHAQKMETVGTLAGGIAHDFNNILGSILGYAEVAREECGENSQLADDLDQVIHGSLQARELVKQILAFSREHEVDRVAVTPESVMEEVMDVVNRTFPAAITIEQSFTQCNGCIIVEPRQIHQILMNLCNNSMHAMELDGGKITLSLHEENIGSSGNTHPTRLSEGRYAVFSVIDTGPGIPEEIQDRIFDPYFTTKEKGVGRGTGIGLAIVHRLVKSHRGGVQVESRKGEGTRVSVYLPLSEVELACQESPAVNELGGSERILLVEDDELLLSIIAIRLERFGYSVMPFTESKKAFNWFSTHSDDVDLLLTDQVMPEMTGVELAKNIHRTKPDLPVLVCTGFSRQIDRDMLEGMENATYILKPVGKEELAKAVRDSLDRRVKK